MSFFSWLRNRTSQRTPRGRAQHRSAALRARPRLEALEDRMVLSTFYAATASALIADINAANTAGGANTIALTAPTSSPYVLTAVNNRGNINDPNALPVIAAGDSLTILTSNGAANPGYGDVIDASKHGRLFDVAKGASLTLENVTLQNGQVYTYSATAEGGAILNQGALVLSQVLVLNNTAEGGTLNGQSAAGGGVWSNGSLTVENSSVFANNSAQGSNQEYMGMQNGGSAYGGGICIAGGTANVTNTFFGTFHFGSGWVGSRGNSALGGTGGVGTRAGSAYGGAVYVASGTVTMNADTIGNPPFDPVTGAYNGATANVALGPGTGFGRGYGGGAYVAGGTVTLANDTIIYNNDFTSTGGFGGVDIASGAKVYLDSFTKTNTRLNNGGNIVGTYTLFAPQIGVFAASANPVTAGASLTLTASNIIDANPAATTTQVAFYVQINGTNTLLGYGTQTSAGVWTLKYTVNLKPGTYTLFAQAEDSFGVFGNPMALTLTVQ